jgi:hypothetical protein
VTGETGDYPLGLAVQIGEAPLGIEGENPFADVLEQIQWLSGIEQTQ